MNTRIKSGKLLRLLLICTIALASQLLLVIKGLCSEGPEDNKGFSASNLTVDLENKIYQTVKSLDYSDQVAHDFIEMVRTWKCDNMYQKLYQADRDAKQNKIPMSQYAQLEEEVVNQLYDIIKTEFHESNDNQHDDLALVIKDKQFRCVGCTQLFYIMGNSLGLNVRGMIVLKHTVHPELEKVKHVSCAVGFHDGNAMLVDLTLTGRSKIFVFTEEYDREGVYWNLKNKANELSLPSKIQFLSGNGVVACIYYNRGNRNLEVCKYTDAISDYNKAIKLAPYFREAYMNRGDAKLELNDCPNAISDYDIAIKLDPNDSMTYTHRGIANRVYGDHAQAISDGSKAIKLNPQDATAYIERGCTYIQIRDSHSKGLADLSKAIEIVPHYAKGYFDRGRAYAVMGSKENAQNDLHKAQQLNPDLRHQIKIIAKEFKLNMSMLSD